MKGTKQIQERINDYSTKISHLEEKEINPFVEQRKEYPSLVTPDYVLRVMKVVSELESKKAELEWVLS